MLRHSAGSHRPQHHRGEPGGDRFLTLFPAPDDYTRPYASTLNYRAGKTRANNALIGLGRDGSVNVFNSGPDAVQFIVDVTGYFR